MKDQTHHLMVDFAQMKEFSQDPLIVERAEGVYLWDVDGKRYLDGISGIFVVNVGHGNRAVLDAMHRQMERSTFAPPLHATNPPAIELATLLTSILPPGFSTVKFFGGGSEATEGAIKMARQYHKQTGAPAKYKTISRYGSYHGSTLGALSASGAADRKSIYEPLGVGFVHVHPPHCYHCPFDQRYPSCARTCAAVVERTILAEDPDTVAAFIGEPVARTPDGLMVPPPEYWPMVREICDRYNVLLITDEVITGFGRLGALLGSERFGFVPDLAACGKGISSGYAPLAALLIQDRVARAFWADPEEHREYRGGHTYGGNPLSAAAGLAAVRYLVDNRLCERAELAGQRLRAGLGDLAAKYDFLDDVRGCGLFLGVQLVADRSTRRPLPPTIKPGPVFERVARRHGLIIRATTSSIVFAPPLTVSDAEIDELLALTDASLAEVAEYLAGAGAQQVAV